MAENRGLTPIMTNRIITDAATITQAKALADAAERELWLTVKEFAGLVGMQERSVREAIRKDRLTYRVERVTKGPKGTIRIIVPRVHAA